MIRQKRVNAVEGGRINQSPIVVLTDNYWLYFGI